MRQLRVTPRGAVTGCHVWNGGASEEWVLLGGCRATCRRLVQASQAANLTRSAGPRARSGEPARRRVFARTSALCLLTGIHTDVGFFPPFS